MKGKTYRLYNRRIQELHLTINNYYIYMRRVVCLCEGIWIHREESAMALS